MTMKCASPKREVFEQAIIGAFTIKHMKKLKKATWEVCYKNYAKHWEMNAAEKLKVLVGQREKTL